jgi:hypothetical protein
VSIDGELDLAAEGEDGAAIVASAEMPVAETADAVPSAAADASAGAEPSVAGTAEAGDSDAGGRHD